MTDNERCIQLLEELQVKNSIENPESLIPDGWEFSTAEFYDLKYHVMLMRSKRGTEWWHSLSEKEREKIDLYVSGQGFSLRKAIISAAIEIKERIGA